MSGEKSIRFIDSKYRELFRIPDGGKIILSYSDGSRQERQCRFLDEYHTEIGGVCYHICEFAEIMERNGTMYAPAKDPRNYDASGRPKPPVKREREGRCVALMGYNAMEEDYEEIIVLGRPALFTVGRIDKGTVPGGLYQYEVRSDDDGRGDPAQIAKNIWANHLGTILTREPIRLPPGGYLDIDPENDWDYAGGDCRTVKGFMQKYPPAKKKDYER